MSAELKRAIRAAGVLFAAGCLVLLTLVLLTGCTHPPAHGVVVDRHYSAGYYYSSTSCNTVGKQTICTPITLYSPPSWELDVWENPSDKSRPHDWASVDEGVYNSCYVGMTYDEGRKCTNG